MTFCHACENPVPEGARFCPSCGAAQSSAIATVTSAGAVVREGSGARVALGTPDLLDRGRFVPGVVLASRYRIIALLGRGGMGEVYRAEDLTLDQPVALKFLPASLSNDPERLSRFRAEVRAARQVSHPNVCRVYDIEEAQGLQFLSMEYVDGEDLGSLLRRIGRLPQDKGIEIARQICAGVAAAHDRGVLHRDLKPANVMLDARGHVRIADFGLAGVAAASEAPAGTPNYMAPEQFAGQPATVQTELYALGLLFYELFTGRAMFPPGSMLDLAQTHRRRTPSNAKAVVADLDPAIDAAIAQCLSTDPGSRPASALAVAAALPGGDPLAAALARGETPSPAVVAAAGGEGALRPLVALALWFVVIAGAIATMPMMERIHPIRAVPMPLPPEVLRDRAAQIIRQAGYIDPPADATGGFIGAGFLDYLRTLPAAERWQRLKSGAEASVLFWYRESPTPLVNFSWLGARVSPREPPLSRTGMKMVLLDSRGRLVNFSATPPRAVAARSDEAPDWSLMFNAAGLDVRNFTPSPPRWRPPFHHAEVHVAWEGPRTGGSTDRPLWVEAGASHGLPVYFEPIQPWERPDEGYSSPEPRSRQILGTLVPVVLMAALLIAAVIVTSHNLRMRRGDVRGATRVAVFMFAVTLCSAILTSDYAAEPRLLFYLMTMMTAQATLLAGAVWAGYVAVEPHMRRWWPETLISWTRLVDGRWRDPRVARDVLIGLAFSAVATVVMAGASLRSPWPLGSDQLLYGVWILDGPRFFVGWLFGVVRWAVVFSVSMSLLILVMTLLVRRKRPAVVLAFVLWAIAALGLPGSVLEHLAPLVAGACGVVVLVRVGILAIAAGAAAGRMLTELPFTADPSVWYAPYCWFVLAGLVAVSMYGFHFSRGGRPLFARSLLNE